MTMEREVADWCRNDRIISVQAITVRLPLKRPVSFSTRRLEAREFVIVRIRTVDGIEGVGYTYGGRLVANAVDYHLADLLVGKPAGEIQGHWQTMYQEILLIGRRGAGIRALSDVDLALWDILVKRTELPLYRLLGGYQDSVPAYFSGGYYRDGMTLDDVAAEAERAVAAGFTSVKIKVGARPSEDLERMRVTREVIGPERQLALDANNAWRSSAEALPHIRRFEAYDPWWIEEPL